MFSYVSCIVYMYVCQDFCVVIEIHGGYKPHVFFFLKCQKSELYRNYSTDSDVYYDARIHGCFQILM